MSHGNGGRYPGIIHYREVSYNNKEYTIGTILFKEKEIEFVIDKDDFSKIEDKAWHLSSEKYISSSFIHDNKRKELYLHNLIMNRLEFPGKGSKETVDHINRIGLDNRKENLRIVSQSQQNMNQIQRSRSILLPEGCDILPEDIPRHIWYIKSHGAHGDRFAIEFKTENICWKTTSSKKVSLKDKLSQAKNKLQEFYKQYPLIDPFNTEKVNIEQSLKKSFELILQL
jgi:hypothetical protein